VTRLEGAGNHVDIDWEKKSYSMTLDGAEVARDHTTFCPLGNDRIAMYSVADGPLTARLPVGWNPKEIAASALFPDRKEAVAFTLTGRTVAVQMVARRPVMIYRRKGDRSGEQQFLSARLSRDERHALQPTTNQDF
jgi:hypothetical protein